MTGTSLFAAESRSNARPKIRLVFCEANNKKPIWPNIGYDFDARRKQMIALLSCCCPDLQFIPAQVVDNPEHTAKVLEADAEVDGYVICIQGLGWRNDIVKLSTTGKPTLLVDNLFGGCGRFLTRISQIMQSGKPVDWVSSSNDQDIVASVRNFSLLKQNKSAADIAALFRATRRKSTPVETDLPCRKDKLPALDLDKALKRLSRTKLLVVTDRSRTDRFIKPAKEALGISLVPISFKEMAGAYDQVDQNAAKAAAKRWIEKAEQIIGVDHSEIEKSGAMYVAMSKLLEKHGAQGISINCLGGFYGGHLKAYPCLGFSQLNNDGLVGGCEADIRSALTMMTIGALTGRPGFISDPVIDTSRNTIIYAHCVAMTKPFGPKGPSNPYHIMTHSEDRKGASMRSLLPPGYMTTSLEIDPEPRQLVMHQATSSGNNPSDMACRTKLEAVVKGDIEKLTENWPMGWHRVTFYGDMRDRVIELCDRLKLKLIEEA
jgi:hypothetical protein